MGTFIFIIIVIVGLIVLSSVMESNRRKKFNIPGKGKKIRYYEGYNKPLQRKIYYWSDGKNICFCNSKSQTGDPLRITIPKSDIIGFAQIGDLTTSTSVKGGGTSLSGAAGGALLFGPVGAIVGGRKKVKSTTTTKDTRQVVLNFKEDGVEKAMLLDNLIYKDLTLSCAGKLIR
ncbi:hypothetical protein GH810_14200 [Acetobacterium paludosum]|uniref:Uncharacterized protein n=1 Tax=Acetobacterium paludosum TaxID=52693 RepID=A0A923HVU3_9FIRM|nr:hypothetical protein [Acetobacterium paludosum]MBC3889463.1 hypothetical protein [Acetobacterium paludosum]